MKRVLALAAALVLLATAALTAAGFSLHAVREEITVTEELLYGSAAALSDITLTARTQFNRRLFWTTAYPLGQPDAAATEFVCVPGGVPSEYDGREDFYLHLGGNHGIGGGAISIDNLPPEFPRIPIQAAAERTPDGETHEETVHLGDYYESYPLSAYGNFGNYFDLRDVTTQAFTYYCALPIPDTQSLTITITKSTNGEIARIHCETGQEPFDLSTQSVRVGDTIYFTMTQLSRDGEGRIDLLPDRLRGIHRFDLATDQYRFEAFDPDSLRRVYPVDAAAGMARQLTASADGERLFLVHETPSGATTLSVLDRSTMRLLQSLPLSAGTDTFLECLRSEGNFLIAIRSDGGFDLLTDRPDGTLELQFRGNLLAHTDSEWLSYPDLSLHYDGRRLTVGFFGYQPPSEEYTPNTYEACAATVMVHDATGLLYAARYHSSADRTYLRYSDDQRGVDIPHPDGNESKGLTFHTA